MAGPRPLTCAKAVGALGIALNFAREPHTESQLRAAAVADIARAIGVPHGRLWCAIVAAAWSGVAGVLAALERRPVAKEEEGEEDVVRAAALRAEVNKVLHDHSAIGRQLDRLHTLLLA